jgi:XrtJ-associated TM-motif-TM protein
MKKYSVLTATLALVFALMAKPARAQGVCDDSPENPTIILAGLAGGAYAVSSLRNRVRVRAAARKAATKS